ncbi:MAG: mandelate racemase [Alphaproteobacteria bacterium]|nr:mandelate racemase [Alphaproteobacteria bacterium]
MRIDSVTLWRVNVPLYQPYNTALGSLAHLDSIVAEISDLDGRVGIGETTIVPGYTHETGDGGWAFCKAHAERIAGLETADAKKGFDDYRRSDPHAVSVLQVALEMLEANPVLAAPETALHVPILTPVNSKDLDAIPAEIESHIAAGFTTLKVKVGWKVDDDLARLALIQEVNAGRATLRLDANQGYSREDAIRFVQGLDPDSLELFEQPCDCADWQSNAAVAEISPVPVMMDESIYGLDDIDRAAAMPGCGYVKLKISKMTGVNLLIEGLQRIREKGLQPVLGNGAATDIGCWIETCVAPRTIDNAGEMCGFLKNREQLLETPLTFENGNIVLPGGYNARLNHAVVEKLAVAKERYSISRAAAE